VQFPAKLELVINLKAAKAALRRNYNP